MRYSSKFRHFFNLLIGVSISVTAHAESITFNADIRPILQNKCFACHGPDQKTRKADLRLDLRTSALRILAPGHPEQSELLQRITATDAEERMPPEESHKEVTPEETATLSTWIAQGATYEEHWAFIAPQPQQPPEVAGIHHPIDQFIAIRLKQEALKMSPPASRETLIRRLTLDLTGLPPSPDETAAFAENENPDAIDRLVDRLLASPSYGEHMAATWLETSRYADTDGYQNDRYRYHWSWRDWVIAAFNRNLPYDQFVTDQLAGDLLPNATLHQQIATGFLRNHRINSEAGSIPEEWHTEYVADRVDMLGTVFLGLTLSCARCHDHKYDPISQREYYGLFAYFNNVPEFGTGPNNGNSPPFIPVPAAWPDVPLDSPALTPAPLAWQKNTQNDGAIKRPVPGDESTVMVMQELPKPRLTYLLNRGIYNQPDKSMPLMASVPERFKIDQRKTGPQTRSDLAQWLVHPDHPLTSRVAVNRLWQQLFGIGLVRTSENLGTQGELPSHPKLLDWLAREFVANDWNIKGLLKLMVTSATYQQSSKSSPSAVEQDPSNRLLARASRIRLPAFAIRDQALASSDLMVQQLYGRPAKPYMPAKIWSAISNNKYEQDQGANLYRRSVYTYWRRTIPPPIMMTLNAGDREVCTVRQARTNTPLQALSLLNNTAFVEAARNLADRVLTAEGQPMAAMIEASRRVTGKLPDSDLRKRLREDYELFRSYYQNHPSAAEQLLQTGNSTPSQNLNRSQLAAMTLIASTLLNLDQSLTRE